MSMDRKHSNIGSEMNTHSEDTAGVAAVDERIIQELREEGGDLLADLVGMFVEEVPGQLTKLEAALRKGDAGATRLTAHTLKGTAANFGASQMQTLASAIEMKARDGALDGAPAIFVQLRAECARVREALEAVR
jgi:histidine phosphotransfer protein HptB